MLAWRQSYLRGLSRGLDSILVPSLGGIEANLPCYQI